MLKHDNVVTNHRREFDRIYEYNRVEYMDHLLVSAGVVPLVSVDVGTLSSPPVRTVVGWQNPHMIITSQTIALSVGGGWVVQHNESLE